MKIRIGSIGKNMGLRYCLFKDHFAVNKYWGGKIINIGFALVYIVFDFRKNPVEDMRTGGIGN